MHLYAFGSICRGDLDRLSDVDLLAIVDRFDDRLDPAKFSIYSYNKMRQLWAAGNPFAWHLYSESRLLFSSDNQDFLESLGEPDQYTDVQADCRNFCLLLEDSFGALRSGSSSQVFEISIVFLAVRNFATCFSLGRLRLLEFSRFSALKLDGYSLKIEREVFDTLQRCRILSTRGVGDLPSLKDVTKVIETIPAIRDWMHGILEKLQ